MTKSNDSAKENIQPKNDNNQIKIEEPSTPPRKSPTADINSLKNDSSALSSLFGGLLDSTNKLMSKSSKNRKETDPTINIPYEPIVYNYQDFARVDHRLKLFLFQTALEDKDEKFVWLARGLICENDENSKNESGYFGMCVMTTTKFYVMRMIGEEVEEISTWLRRHLTVSVERVEKVQVLPWKIGVSFSVKGIGNLYLLLQDISRTEAFMGYLKSEQNLI